MIAHSLFCVACPLSPKGTPNAPALQWLALLLALTLLVSEMFLCAQVAAGSVACAKKNQSK